MQRLVLVLAVTATMLCCGSATRAQALYPAEFAACQPLPPWYPRGWELMGALSMRHLCLWTCLLSASLLPLSCSLSAPARVRSRCHICVPAGGGEDAVERFCSVRVAGSDSGSLIRRQTACTELTRLSHSRALGIPIWEDRGLAKRPPPRSRWRPPHGIKSPDCLRGLAP